MSAIKTHPDANSLAHAAATHIMALAEAAIAAHDHFSIALSGGSTPRATYERLALYTRLGAQGEVPLTLDWGRVHVFWGDERCVPPDDAASNYRLAHDAWLEHTPIPPGNVHRIRGELDPERAADEYEAELRAFFGPTPRFDLILLGLGEDGHTASLFPGTAALHETARWVVAHCVAGVPQPWRVTLTPPALNAAANVIFLVAGAGKAARLKQVLQGTLQPDVLPAQIVQPGVGRLLWLVDVAAASLL